MFCTWTLKTKQSSNQWIGITTEKSSPLKISTIPFQVSCVLRCIVVCEIGVFVTV